MLAALAVPIIKNGSAYLLKTSMIERLRKGVDIRMVEKSGP